MPGSDKRRSVLATAGIAGMLVVLALSERVLAEADGPDAWRVAGVAEDDALNARMGPGSEYPVIGEFSHDARGLRQVTCVPLLIVKRYRELTGTQRQALPPRWCLMQSADRTLKGWVAQRYLAEDSGWSETPQNETASLTTAAERLVERLYRDHLRAGTDNITSPLHPSRAGDFFIDPLAAHIAVGRLQANPLFGGQDASITDLDIALDPEQPMLRGMITVNADFVNFGQPQRAVVNLRVEDGAPRIIRIVHEDWTFE